MTEEHTDAADAPMPLKKMVITGVVTVAFVLGAVYLLMRISSPAIWLGQAPPSGHWGLDCGLCHTVSPVPPAGVTP
jgi:hypothetical protein